MHKDVEVKFDNDAYNEYRELQDFVAKGRNSKNKPTYEQLLSSINTAIKNLKANPYYGDLIPKKYISKGAYQRYGADKLLRIELIGYWRLIYTLIGEEVRIIALILEFMDHKGYNKIFRYKGR